MTPMNIRLDRDTLLMIGFHLLPLLGVWLAGWDGQTLLMLYWLETLVIGIWTVVLVALGRRQPIMLLSNPGQPPSMPGIGMALFVTMHAGIFMFVHLFFLQFAFAIDRTGPEPDPVQAIVTLLVQGGLWLPLAGLFLIRGLVTADALRRGDRVDRYLIGFYFRIVLMQFAIIGGGFVLILFGAQGALVILIAARIGFELAVPSIEDYVEEHVAKQHAGRTGDAAAK